MTSPDGSVYLSGVASPSNVVYWSNTTGAWKAFTIADQAYAHEGNSIFSQPEGAPLAVDGSGERHLVYEAKGELRYMTTRP